MKVLFDSNVIIDAISNRPNSNQDSKRIFLLSASGELKGYLASKQITDIYCVLRKYVDNKEKRREFISFLLEAFKILSISEAKLKEALSLDIKNYEDAVLCVVAKRNDIDCIVTNNIKDCSNLPIEVCLPSEIH